MASDEQLRQRVLDHAAPRFFTYGFRQVRTEDLAGELGMSKKSLYRLFGSKNEICREVVRVRLNQVDKEITELFADTGRSFIGRLKGVFQIIAGVLSTIGGPFIFDLNRHAPQVWQEIQHFRRERVFSRLEGLIEEGQEEGTVRPEIEPRLLVAVFVAVAENVLTPQRVVELETTPAVVLNLMAMLLSAGILTEQGRSAMTDGGLMGEGKQSEG